MTVVPGPRGWPLAYDYQAAGRTARIGRDASGWLPVLHLRLFNPSDDHYGFSPLEAAAFAIDVHNASGAWNKALLDNSARPSGALVYANREAGDRLSAEQFERLKAELGDAHAGTANAGRPLLLEGGLDWRPMSLSPADMDFIAGQHAAAREIALAFGVPPQLLGVPGDATYANYREANGAFWRRTVAPLAEQGGAGAVGVAGAEVPGGARGVRPGRRAGALGRARRAVGASGGASFLTDAERRRLAGLEGMTASQRWRLDRQVSVGLLVAGWPCRRRPPWCGPAGRRPASTTCASASTPRPRSPSAWRGWKPRPTPPGPRWPGSRASWMETAVTEDLRHRRPRLPLLDPRPQRRRHGRRRPSPPAWPAPALPG